MGYKSYLQVRVLRLLSRVPFSSRARDGTMEGERSLICDTRRNLAAGKSIQFDKNVVIKDL